MLNVLIVEDDPMARKLLEIYIKNSENYNHVQSLESAALAEFCCRTNKVDVILMDVCTAMDASGLDATEKIKKNFPNIKVIIMTSQPECSFIDRAREVGVDSFWYKSSNEEELMTVIERTMMGEIYTAKGNGKKFIINVCNITDMSYKGKKTNYRLCTYSASDSVGGAYSSWTKSKTYTAK